jgi:hypothetical protein
MNYNMIARMPAQRPLTQHFDNARDLMSECGAFRGHLMRAAANMQIRLAYTGRENAQQDLACCGSRSSDIRQLDPPRSCQLYGFHVPKKR